jgi:DNA-binding transcriptional regulator YiaG
MPSRLLATDGTALLRELMQGYFDRCAEQERRVKVVGADGIERRDVRTSSRRIETPVGEIEVKRRLLYQAPGMEGIAPLDAALGLPDEKYTYDLRRIVAEESAKSSFDEVVELVDKRTGGEVPKRQVKELTVRAAQDFDAFYLRRSMQITQQELADRMGIVRETVAAWESNLKEISPQHDLILRVLMLNRARGSEPVPTKAVLDIANEVSATLQGVRSEPAPRKELDVRVTESDFAKLPPAVRGRMNEPPPTYAG